MGVHGAEAGWLGELVVDQAMVYSTGGCVVPWIPVVDAHGIDRAYSWLGSGAPALVQIKTATVLEANGNFEWTVRVDALRRHHRFFVVLVALPKGPWEEPTFWCLSGATLAKLASEEYDRRKRTELYLVQASPLRSDRLARYRCSAEQLWQRLLPEARLLQPVRFRFPTLRVDKGGVFELASITDILTGNRKDLLVFRPAFDVHGRDLLVLLVGTPYAIYLQVKGTAVIRGRDNAQFLIRRQTFVPADDFWLVLRFWDDRRGELFAEEWLIPSVEAARRTAHQHEADGPLIKVCLDPARDPFADHRHPSREIAHVLRGALRELRHAA